MPCRFLRDKARGEGGSSCRQEEATLSKRRWASVGSKERVWFLGVLDRRWVTCTVLSPQKGGRMTAQLIFSGKIIKVLREKILSDSYWCEVLAAVETILNRGHARCTDPFQRNVCDLNTSRFAFSIYSFWGNAVFFSLQEDRWSKAT